MSWPDNVDRSQCRIDFFRGSGAGGQKRNKTSSACRITHIPTGHVASCENHRSQLHNRSEAFIKLCRVLVPLMKQAARTDTSQGTSTEVIRTYHEKRREVKDHRTGRTYPYQRVLDGSLDEIHEGMMGE